MQVPGGADVCVRRAMVVVHVRSARRTRTKWVGLRGDRGARARGHNFWSGKRQTHQEVPGQTHGPHLPRLTRTRKHCLRTSRRLTGNGKGANWLPSKSSGVGGVGTPRARAKAQTKPLGKEEWPAPDRREVYATSRSWVMTASDHWMAEPGCHGECTWLGRLAQDCKAKSAELKATKSALATKAIA